MAGRLLRSRPAMVLGRTPQRIRPNPPARRHGARACRSGMLRPFLLLVLPTRQGCSFAADADRCRPGRVRLCGEGWPEGGSFPSGPCARQGGRGWRLLCWRSWPGMEKTWQNDGNYFFTPACYNGSFVRVRKRRAGVAPLCAGGFFADRYRHSGLYRAKKCPWLWKACGK